MPGWKWWPRAVAWLFAASSVAVLAMAFLRRSAGGRPLSWADILDWVVAVVTLGAPVAGVFVWARKKTHDPPEELFGNRIDTARHALATAVEKQWTDEARFRDWEKRPLMRVRWRAPLDPGVPSDAGVVKHPPHAASSAEIAELAEKFRACEPRRLVILGGPGAGKTTLAGRLLRQLLATRKGREDEAVPVLLPVAQWDTERHPRLHAWLSEQLYQDYPGLRWLGVDGFRQMIGRGYVLPILDGLDELPGPAQATALKRLNDSLGADDQVVLTSRTAEYTHAVGGSRSGRGLDAAVVLEPLPVTPLAAAAYLEDSLQSHQRNQPAWDRALKILRTERVSALAEVAATPLNLWLLRTVYIKGDGDPEKLTDPARFPTPDALRAHLFDHLVPAVLPPAGDVDQEKPLGLSRTYRSGDVERWLAFLAHHLTNQPSQQGSGTRDFAWWKLARPTLNPRTVGIAVGLTVWLSGLAVWLAVGLIIGISGFADGILTTLRGALLVGFVDGFAGALAGGGVAVVRARSWSRESPGFANLTRRPGSLRLLIQRVLGVWLLAGLAVWLVTDLMFWIATELVSGFTREPAGGLLAWLAAGAIVGAAAGLGAGLVSGVIHWIEIPTPADHVGTPLNTWRADRSLNLFRTIAGVLVTMLVVGLVGGILGRTAGGDVAGIPREIAYAFAFALTFGVVGGLVAGLALGRHHAWLVYVVATYRLASRHHLPRRLMPFLDDMHRLGLLRAVGAIYQFRHADLHDHFAAAHDRPSGAS